MTEIFAPFSELSPASLIVQSSHPPTLGFSLRRSPSWLRTRPSRSSSLALGEKDLMSSRRWIAQDHHRGYLWYRGPHGVRRNSSRMSHLDPRRIRNIVCITFHPLPERKWRKGGLEDDAREQLGDLGMKENPLYLEEIPYPRSSRICSKPHCMSR